MIHVKTDCSTVYKAFTGEGGICVSGLESNREVKRILPPKVQNMVI
jgi:hypothetical protein